MRILWLVTICTLLSFASCKIICNNSKESKCKCFGRRIQCRTKIQDDIIIDVDNFVIDIECPTELKNFHINKFPNVTLDRNITVLNMRYCPLPLNDFKEIFDWFSIQNMDTFRFYHSNLNGTVLRKEYFQSFDTLRHLILTYNGIKNLDKNFFANMTQLRLLELQNNNINLTKNIFKNLQYLKYLDLSYNNLQYVPYGVFQAVRTLTNLHLRGNQLTKIDDFIFAGLLNLRLLELGFNKIETITENAFATLKDLTQINLSSNSLTTLPRRLFQRNKNLTKVYLKKCNLSEIPENLFENTTTLQDLMLGKNNLEQISETLFKGLVSLETIFLYDNKIKSISHLFKGLEQITLLYLQDNLIEELSSETFADLINLKEINLKGNRIKQIHSLVFSKNHKLKSVILSHNEIEDNFETVITSTQTNSLINWNLNHNRIQQIKLENLQNVSIRLDYNNITVVDLKDIKVNTTLKISFNENPIICNCRNYNLLNHLKNQSKSNLTITAKNVTCFGSQEVKKTFENLELSSLVCSLEEISKNFTECPKNCSCIWRPFDNSVVINCSNKSLAEYPQIDLTQFKNFNYSEIELHLENNELETGPMNHFSYVNITKLFLSNNKIKTINWVPPRLKSLHLDQNHISKIPPKVIEILNRTDLVNLTLNNNPWLCDCNAEILAQFLRTVPALSTNIYCANTTLRFIDMKREDFCKSQTFLYLTTVIISLLLISALFAIFYYRYKQMIKIWLLSHNLSWLSEENLDKDKIYDVFISYSHKDEVFVRDLISFLENDPDSFKVCVQYRDWILGEDITTQITNSVLKSRRTLMVLSKNFLESKWGKMAFRTAHTQALSDGINRVVILWYEDVEVEKLDDEELKVYLKTRTYVKWEDKHSRKNLRNALRRTRNWRQKTEVLEDEDMLIQPL
ncbi:protein toll-like isoform X1 [Tribolium madens]|uniref:protein toll-like isoform X1 n=1 Tax=Tribolium madens TaxID=41895 RepID=UPI001CF74967|nr:protein toll-like isoform X1 [Tribolium madens]XP_044258939.1 protein toll-like isoform X1 [Tribolium madens]